MKTYLKPTIEVVKADLETALNFGSIPVKPGTVNPGESLAPEIGGIIDDEDSENM